MDQRPGQNVDLGLYFHREGPVSPKIKLKNQFLWQKIREQIVDKFHRFGPSGALY